MAVETKQKLARREVHYDSFQDFLDDAQRLASGQYRQIGNWSLGGILKHLANAMNSSIDGLDSMKVPWFLKLLRPIVKRRFLKGPFPSGFQLNKEAAAVLVADPSTTVEEGMTAVRDAIDRLGRENKRSPHPAVGQLNVAEWNQVHLRHAEMHMSHLVPE